MYSSIKNFVFFILFVSLSFAACHNGEIGSGKEKTETRNVSPFTEIELQSSADVEFIQGTTQKVEVRDFENLLPLIEVKVLDGKLIITTKDNISISNSNAKITITTPETITKTSLDGSGNIVFRDAMSSLKVISISGSGDVESKSPTSYKELAVSVSGSGNITLKGKASNETVVLDGSGDIDLEQIEAQNVDCTMTGSGDITVTALQKLNVTCSGSGNVYYFGTPSVQSEVTGSGEVIKK